MSDYTTIAIGAAVIVLVGRYLMSASRASEACVTHAGGPSTPSAPGPARRRAVPEQAITNVCSMFPQCVRPRSNEAYGM